MHGWGKWNILDIIYFLSALHAACTVKEKNELSAYLYKFLFTKIS